MTSFKNFNFFKDKKQDDNAHPDEEKHADNCFSTSIHYKKVKQCMQYDGNEQPKWSKEEFLSGTLKKCECKKGSYGAGGKYM